MMPKDDCFTPPEREALARWAAPTPPPTFAARVLAAASVSPIASEVDGPGLRVVPPLTQFDRRQVGGGTGARSEVDFRRAHLRDGGWGRGVAAAAALLLVVGGLWSLRGVMRAAFDVPSNGAGGPVNDSRQRAGVGDAGPGPEAHEVHTPVEDDAPVKAS